MSWEESFRSWGTGPGITEQQKIENAETAIRKAIKADNKLAELDISIIPQGSYRSRTNVKQNSDVDICVCLNSTFFVEYPDGRNDQHYGNSTSGLSFPMFRELLGSALVNYFGSSFVQPGNKAFDINSNSYRVDADVVPAFAYRHYYGEGQGDFHQPEGIAFLTDREKKMIVNWPHQTYKNGETKHQSTGRRYRKMVRILKRLRNRMQEEQIVAANDIASFLIESMVWSVPNSYFNHATYSEDVREVLAHCFNETLPNGRHAEFGEVNDFKYLFGEHQAWTREQAHNFFAAAWDYLELK